MTVGDKAIFKRSLMEDDPNWITNYYMRSEDSGTWWRHISEKNINKLLLDESRAASYRWKTGYDNIEKIWKHLGRPEYFAPSFDDVDVWKVLNHVEYKKHYDELRRVYRLVPEVSQETPVFHHPHGIQLLPWQLDLWKAKHPVTVNVGGFGCSKTWGKLLCMLVRCVSLRGYRGLILAPWSQQSDEVYRQALGIIQGTVFEQFLIKAVRKPRPEIVFGNDMVGETTLQFFPVLDGAGKLLTLTADEAMVDQSEGIDDLDGLIRDVGTRLRGTVSGRPRIGQISLIANSADNPQLWDWVDEADTDPEYVWSYSPHTFENTYLTISDFVRFEKQVGKDEQSRKVHLLGARPVGSGEHFPYSSIMACRATWLDDIMNEALSNETKGYVVQKAPRVDVHTWEMPYEKDHIYAIAADPGWGNPPARNAAAIMVWDITDFPRTPAIMKAFCWVFGNGSPNPWLAKFTEYTIKYRAMGMNAFDSTGVQSGYERLTGMSALKPVPIALSGQRKYVYLTLTKKFAADGLFQIPSIAHIFSQMSKYRLPDDHIRQDLVMALLVTSAVLEPLFYVMDYDDEELSERNDDRYDRPGKNDRYERRGSR